MNTRSVQRSLNPRLAPGSHLQEGMNEPAMRIGAEFQVVVPEMDQATDESSQGTGSMLVWTPNSILAEEDLDSYLRVSKEQFGYGAEQALGLLYWHKYNIEKAVEDLPNFCPLQDDWTMEDKVTFEQAFHYHGKNFQRIRAMLPDKPISSLVKYYYLWKRTYSQFSLMDKHARKNVKRISSNLPVSNDDTDSNKSGSSRSENQVPLQPFPILMNSKGKQLPKGMHLSTSELAVLASDIDHAHLHLLDREILEIKKQLQANKQELVVIRGETDDDGIENLRPANFTRKSGAPARWTDEEIEVALQVIRQNGKDYEALATAIETKTVAQCRNFFTNYKRKLNLPRLIAEYEIKNGRKHSRYSKQAREQLQNGRHLDSEQPLDEQPMDPQGVCMAVGMGLGEGLMETTFPQAKRQCIGNGVQMTEVHIID